MFRSQTNKNWTKIWVNFYDSVLLCACYLSPSMPHLDPSIPTVHTLPILTGKGIEYKDAISDGTSTVHKTGPSITIYNSQRNIALAIIAKALHRGILPAEPKDFKKINALFVGPHYAVLRDQTQKDLTGLVQEILAGSYLLSSEIAINSASILQKSSFHRKVTDFLGTSTPLSVPSFWSFH